MRKIVSFYAIVSPKVDPNDLVLHTDALDQLRVDYSDLLQLTFANWHEFGSSREDDEGLRVAIENYLATYAVRRLRDYAHMQEVIPIIVDAVTRFHENLQEQLGPLLDKYGLDVQINLSRHLHQDALIRIETDK